MTTSVNAASAASIDLAISAASAPNINVDVNVGNAMSGSDGGYYTPTISADGVLTWTPSKSGMPYVGTKTDVVGPAGKDGTDGIDGGYYVPSVTEDGVLTWTPTQQEMQQPGSMHIAGPQGEQGEKGDTGDPGKDGVSPVIEVSEVDENYTVVITDVNGEKTIVLRHGKDGGYYTPMVSESGVLHWEASDPEMPALPDANIRGPQGDAGISVTHEWQGTTLVVTSGSGTSEADLKGDKGDTGASGTDGEDGFSPTVQVEIVEGGHTVTITDRNGPKSFFVADWDGISTGADGEDGGYYTPSVSQEGVLTWTPSKEDMPAAASANVLGPQGVAGPQGEKGEAGNDGVSPTVAVQDIDGGHIVTITDASGAHSFTVLDGVWDGVETDPTVPEWAKQAAPPTYTAEDVGALPADTQIPGAVSELTNDAGFITKAVSDLENYYAKSVTYTKAEIDSRISAIPKFSIAVVSALPTEGMSETTIYLVADGEDGNLYTEYIYVSGAWEVLGSQRVDLTGYATQSWVSETLQGYQPTGDYALRSEVPTTLGELTDDAEHRLVTDEEKAAWNSKTGSSTVSATLLASAWAGVVAPYTQVLTIEGLTANMNGIIRVAHESTITQREAVRMALLGVAGQEEGKLTIVADGELPEVDIPVCVLLIG